METPASTFDSDGAAAYNAVFVDTSLDTHLAVIVSDTDKVSDLKKRIQQEHPLCFPNVGEIKISALKVKCRGKFYHLSDSMFVKNAFREVHDSWFLSADASSAKADNENYNSLILDSGNLIAFQTTNNNTSAEVVDLLPDGPSKRLPNFEDAFLLQDDDNQLIKHKSVVRESDSCDSTKYISEDLQIGIDNAAGNNLKVLSHAAENDLGNNDECQRDFVNLKGNDLPGKFSKPRQTVKEKWKQEGEHAVEKSLGDSRMASNSVRESSQREIRSSGAGGKGTNEEHLDTLVRIQDHRSVVGVLQSSPTAKRICKTLKEGDENSLAKSLTSDSVEDGTRLELRRSSNNDKGIDVDFQSGFVSVKKSKLLENPNMESLRIMETVGRHLDGEANITLASGSVSAGPAFSEQCIASPKKRQENGKTNNVLQPVDHDVQADDADMERQTEEPELGFSSEKLSTPVDHHPGEQGHPPLIYQQPAELEDGVFEHSDRTVTPGDETVEPKKSSKKTNKSRKTRDQVRPEAYGTGDRSRKEDPPYVSQHPSDLKEDSEHDDRSGTIKGGVEQPKMSIKEIKKYNKSQDPVEVELAFLMEHSEGIANDVSLSMVPPSDDGDHLSNITTKEGQAFVSQQSSDLKKDDNSLHDSEADRHKAEVVEHKKPLKKKRKSTKTDDQAEITSDVEHCGGPMHNVSSAEVPAFMRGDDSTDPTPKEDPPSLAQRPNNLQEDEASEYHNGSVGFEAEVLESKRKSKKRKGSKKTFDQVGAETASGLEHSRCPASDVSLAKVPMSARVVELNDASPKDNPSLLTQQLNNIQQGEVSEYDSQPATLETTAVEAKKNSKKRKRSRQTPDKVGTETPSLIEHFRGPRNDFSSAEIRMTASGDDLTDAAAEDDPPFSSLKPNNLRNDGVFQFDNGSATHEAKAVKPKKNAKDRKKSGKTEDQAGIETASVAGHSGGLKSDISMSGVAECVRGDYPCDVTREEDVLSAPNLLNNPLEVAVSLNDNKTGTPESELGEPKKSLKGTKKSKRIQDHAGEEMSSGTRHSGDPTNDISQVFTSVRDDHVIDVTTDKGADDVIRDVLESLQHSNNDEPNAEYMGRKSSRKSNKQKNSIMVDSLAKISNDASHQDHGASVNNGKVEISSKSTKKRKKVNPSSINQLDTSNLEAENEKGVKSLPKHGLRVTGSPRELLLRDEGVPLEASFEKDGSKDDIYGLGKSGRVKNQNRSNIVAGSEVSSRKHTNSKEVIEKVEAKKIRKNLDQPSSEPDSLSSPMEVHVEVPVNGAKNAQSNKLRFTSKDAQRLNSIGKSSHLKEKPEQLALATNTNKKSDAQKHKVIVRNAFQKNDGEVMNISKTKKSLFGSGLFKDGNEESSEDNEIDNSDVSPRTPSNDSALLDYSYDDSDADANSLHTGEKDSGRSMTKACHVSPKGKSLVDILLNSSRYKKARLVASESQFDDEDEECVPDSQQKE